MRYSIPSNNTTRHSNNTTPHSNNTTPHSNNTTPHSNNTTPHSNNTTPHSNNTQPPQQQPMPSNSQPRNYSRPTTIDGIQQSSTTNPPPTSPTIPSSPSSYSSTSTTSNSPNLTHSRSLSSLAQRLAAHGPVKTLATPRRVRILFNGAIIADTLGTSGALYVWEHEFYPQFYLPMEAFIHPSNFDVHLTPGDSITDPSGTIIGGGLKLSVKRHDSPPSDYKTLSEMVLFAADLSGPGSALQNMVKVRFDAVGQWFEEDTPIYIHPKDPFKRIDILASSRRVRVLVADVPVATSPSSVHLYETSLPPRYYLPLTSIDTAVLRPSTTRSQCPYKGEAQYHSVAVKGEVYRDLVWYYTRPTVECAAIAGLCCFYGELVDVEFEVNGVWRREERPKTHFV